MLNVNKTKNPTNDHTAAECADCVVGLPVVQQETLVMHEDGTSTLMCVKCPFCKQIVNAHMTKTTISCPECAAEVTR